MSKKLSKFMPEDGRFKKNNFKN